MKLTRIEALRFGALEDACLSGFGDGLTVVLGPNESGKSTFTALTRHVLYGFPDGRSKERAYRPRSGVRAGRLVFADGPGEWAIERTDGKSRGAVSIDALSGPERPALLGELVGGVSEQSFQAIFAFGLDDLPIARSGSANDDIVAQLYAAGAGLTVNPMDVRAALDGRAGALYAAGRQKPVVNTLMADMRAVNQEIRDLETEARNYAGEQKRLHQLSEQLAPLKSRRDELEQSARALDRDAQSLGAALEQAAALRAELTETDASILDLQRGAEVIDVDERVLAVAPELRAVIAETSGFRQRLDAIATAENSADDTERRIAAGPAIPAGAQDTAENRAAVESWRDRLATLQADVAATQRAAAASAANAAGAESVAEVQTSHAPASGRALPLAFAVVAIVIGAIFVAVGLLLAPPQLLVSALGAAVAILGVVGLVVALLRGGAAPSALPLTADAARLRAEAEAARVLAETSASQLEAARAQWRAWLAERALDANGEDPVAVRQLLDDIKERDALAAQAAEYRAIAAREREKAEAWVLRLVDLVRSYDDTAGQIPPLTAATELAARAETVLARALAAQEERASMLRDIASTTVARQGLAQRAEAAESLAAEICTRRALDSTDPMPALQVLTEETAEARTQLDEQYELLADEHSGLRARLDTEGRDDRMTRARQHLEGLQARAAEAADRYLVSAVGVRLLDSARERFDRVRQPEVVRVAGKVFSAMTLGRYTDVRIPLDAEISVVTAEGDLKPAADLSQGTSEQLYLALRVGLIASLGQLGQNLPVLMDDVAVNYDPERLVAATAAITELSRVRQTILFTCHSTTAEVMLGSVPGSKLLSLDRCELRG